MNIRGVEIDFNFLDADDIERFEKEAYKVKDECNKQKKETISLSEAIRKECKIINNFFDNVFGQGISEKIFKGKNNLDEHIKAFEDIVRAKIEQQANLNEFDRYLPNREQRRYNKYKGKKHA